MIRITDKAREAFNEKNNESNGRLMIRIAISGYGWGGPSLKIVLDEQKGEEDIIIDIDGIKVIYDNSLNPYVKNIIIDYSSVWVIGGFLIRGGGRGCC